MKSKKIIKRIIASIAVALLCGSLLGCQSKADRLAEEAAAEESRLAAEAAAEESRLAAEAAAGESRLAAEAAAEEARLAEIEGKIIEVLEWTPAVGGFSLSLSSAIANTFHQYKWDFQPYENSETLYIATFTGNYSPNPRDLPQLSYSGEISILVDIENFSAQVYSDPNDISDAFVLLALPY